MATDVPVCELDSQSRWATGVAERNKDKREREGGRTDGGGTDDMTFLHQVSATRPGIMNESGPRYIKSNTYLSLASVLKCFFK